MRAYVLPPADLALVDAMGDGLRDAGVVAVGVHERGPATPVTAWERQAFAGAFDKMMEADLLVADVSAGDAEAGWALAWFLAKGRLAVLTCRRDDRGRLGPLVTGNPSPWQRLVLYGDAQGLREGLAAALRG